MKEDDNFCGYSCSAQKEKLQEIIDETVDFSNINPEWGLIMLGKFVEMVYDARLKLSMNLTRIKEEEKEFLKTEPELFITD
jgi:hypothetical protein